MVITDWKMPNMNGLSLLRNIRANQEMRDLPVLIMSASGLPSAVGKAHDLGVNAWLKKPFKLGRLVSIINEELRMPPSSQFIGSPTGC